MFAAESIKRKKLLWAAWMLASLWTGCGHPLDNRDNKPYNVLLITVDTLRADRLGAYGHEGIETPHMDRLAAEGIRFTRAYTPSPVTLPAHVSLMTGSYPTAHGVRNNGIHRAGEEVNTLAEILKSRGYDTAAVIGAYVLDSSFGLDQGFDVYDDAIVYGADGADALFYAERKGEEVTRRALGLLEGRKKGPPFFIWVHYFDPHNIYRPPQPYARRYAHDLYDGEVAYVDEQIGVLLKMLDITGLDEDTLVILTSDHGESLNEHGEYTHGVLVYDSTLHVPLVIRNPALIPSPEVITSPVSLVDIAPTVLDLLNIDPGAEGEPFQGSSLVPLMAGRPDRNRDLIYFETLLPYFDFGWAGLRGMRSGSLKYIASREPELYHTGDDPGETANLYGDGGGPAAKLEAALKAWTDRQGPVSDGTGANGTDSGGMNSAVQNRLAALGYSSGATHTRIEGDPFEGPDPKEKIWVETALHQANHLFYHGDYSGAVASLEALLDQEPENPNLLTALGSYCNELGRLQEAEGYFGRLIEIQPDNARAWNYLGIVFTRRSKNKEAEEAFAKALELDPAHVDALYNFALLLIERGDPDRAEIHLKAAIEHQPHFLKAYNNLGVLYASQGRHREAVRSLKKALELNPNFGNAHYNCARTYFMLGDYPKAIRHLDSARRLGMEVEPEFMEALKPYRGKRAP